MIPMYVEASMLRVLVIGGGSEAEKKSRRFLGHGSHVTVYSLEFTDWLSRTAEAEGSEGRLTLVRGDVRDLQRVTDLIEENDLVIYTVPDMPSAEDFVAEESRRRRKLFILSTNAERTMVAMPIEVKASGLRIAVSSEGRSTLVAIMAADEIRGCMSGRRDIEVLLDALGYAKATLKGRMADHKRRIQLYHALFRDPALRELAARGDLEGARRRVDEVIGGAM